MLQLSLAPSFEAGLAPYQVKGDPVAALIAQVNRFAGKASKAGAQCSARTYVRSAYPISPALTDGPAFTAALILNDFYACTPLDTYGAQKARWALEGMSGDSVQFVNTNINEITLTLAQLADSLGYAPASIGITDVDPKLKPKSKAPWYIAGGLALAALGVAYTRRKQ